jgi:hypothetical protein
MTEYKNWCELHHAAGRLLLYQLAVKVLLLTGQQWPKLFENFEIQCIASSISTQSPLRNKRKVGSLSMKNIIGRMTSNSEKLEIYRDHALDLEKFEMDKIVQDQAESKSFRPIVHAELLVLDSLLRDGGTHPSRFFGGYRYIGSSKPTCTLCDYYFSCHPSRVEVRPTHRNLYLNWRMPDLYDSQGSGAIKEREKLMNKILERVRKDAFRALLEKATGKNQHDSNMDPTCPIDCISSQKQVDTDGLATTFKAFDIEFSEHENLSDCSLRSSFDSAEFSTADSDFEGDGGGVKL